MLGVLCSMILGVVMVTAPTAFDVEDPLASSPPIASPTITFVPGGAVSTLRGPAGFSTHRSNFTERLDVEAISVRAVLHPDVASVEQTYTVSNPGRPFTATIGIRQEEPTYGNGRVVRTPPPLGAAAWVGGIRLPDEQINIRRTVTTAGTPGGYEVGMTVLFPPGQTTFVLRTIIRTVGSVSPESRHNPEVLGWSRLALRTNHYAWGWSPGNAGKAPRFAASLALASSLADKRIHAEEWTPAVREGNRFWWQEMPWIVVRYDAPHMGKRAASRDELELLARELLSTAPLGHVVQSKAAEPTPRPDRAAILPPLDHARAQRALIVPIFALALLLVVVLVVRRYNRAPGRLVT